MVKLQDLLNAGFNTGSRIEITLMQGAEYFNGYTPAPTVDMQGWDAGDNMQDAPGRKIIGYIKEVKSKSSRTETDNTIEKVVMYPTDSNMDDGSHHFSAWYVNVSCIHSYRQ
jgi:hypothetical protein